MPMKCCYPIACEVRGTAGGRRLPQANISVAMETIDVMRTDARDVFIRIG